MFRLRCVQLGSHRQAGEGIRLGTVRFLPRGVRRENYSKLDYFDLWLPLLAPSKELISQLHQSKVSFSTFSKRYRNELKKPEARQVVQLVAAMAKQMPVSVGCYCEDESKCHRSVLREVLHETAGEKVR